MKSFLRAILSVSVFLHLILAAHGQQYQTVNAFDIVFTNPVAIATAPGDSNRLFVLEQRGTIAVITNLSSPNRTTFMDIIGRVTSGGEQGLLGMAFHPGYESNHFFYVTYTTSTSGRLSRFEISPTNANVGLPGSELILINQADQAANHNAGDLHFGSDGYLYMSLGDEGGANDSFNNSQRINGDFFSGILRLDVDKKPGNLQPNVHAASSTNYFVPADNPFVGATSFNGAAVNPANVRTEFWAVGLRNPWRIFFDPPTGLLYCADVGQGAWEEIDIITKGGNYGWAFYEGFHFGPKSNAIPVGFSGVLPILEYAHGGGTFQGNSVTGGVVYRGNQIPSLYGWYVFADYVSGNLWRVRYDGTNATGFERLLVERDISAFGTDPSNGDVLIADLGDDRIKRLVVPVANVLLTNLVRAGAVWKYLDNGSDQGTAWRAADFDDNAWASGAAELGYGDNDEMTVVNSGAPNRFITTYFRHAFNVDDPNVFTGLVLRLLRDDGAVVYLNGQEAFRSNIPANPTYTTPATAVVGDADETTFYATNLNANLLVPGRNVFAVEVHQQSASSSDVSFNLELSAERRPQLRIVRAGNTVQISWPAPAPNYRLQSSPALGAMPPWTAVTEPVVPIAGASQVTTVITGDSLFFRLVR